jgi:ribose transport system ATP-binding protein
MPQLVRMMVGHDVELTEVPSRSHQTSQEVLRVENLTQQGVLDGVSFKLHAGEIVTFAGLVGSGRTETVRAIFGVDRVDSGEIYLDGRRADINHPEAAARLGLGFLTEDRLNSGLAMDLSVNDNITLPTLTDFEKFGFLTLKREQRAVHDAIKQLNIKTPSEKQIVRYLSGGNQQKVVLAKWLMANSRILLLDEPTQGIDVGAKEEVHRLMIEFVREQGGSIVMVSSDLHEVLRMSDRILVMHEGRIVADLPGEHATRESVMQYALGVKQQQADSTREQGI